MQETVRRYRSRSRYVGSRSADLSWQERARQFANPYGYVSDASVRRSRMTFDVELPDRAADMTPRYTQERRMTTRSEELARLRRDRDERSIPAVSRDGMRGSVAMALLAALVLILCIVLLDNLGQIRQVEARTARNEQRIAEIGRRCQNLDHEYEARTDSVDVLYSAVDQGMISTHGARKIYLQVPEEACMMPVAVGRTNK